MAQTHIGAMKVASKRSGYSLDEYLRKSLLGEKWCYSCKQWKAIDSFSVDISRYDKRSALCRICKSNIGRKRYIHKLITHRGPFPDAPRDGDKKQARRRINVEVRTGRRPHPNTISCVDCGHIWSSGERRHEYDHYLGYAPENHSKVQSVCTICHRRRADKLRKYQQYRDQYGKYTSIEEEKNNGI